MALGFQKKKKRVVGTTRRAHKKGILENEPDIDQRPGKASSGRGARLA
jgi:hypothetical protein